MLNRNRRDFLRAVSIAPATLAVSTLDKLFAAPANPGNWRTFELTTRIEVLKPSGVTRIWVPGALTSESPYQRTISESFVSEGGTVTSTQVKADGLKIFRAEIPAGAKPIFTLTSRISTRNWAVDLATSASGGKLSSSEAKYWLRPTKLLPTDGIVKERATSITSRAKTDLDKALAIYEWIIENTYRDPKVRGCGVGNIRFMLESGDLGGKCADLNALYVGLARAAGIPARDVYGIRVAPSELGYKSLGASSENVTKAQHCRAEVHLNGYGWVPVDPADVRKVMLEEPPGNRPIEDDMVKQARARLFGAWEMNWMAYSFAHDISLPGAKGSPTEFLMYPQAETADQRLDCLNPDSFKYEITTREIKAA